MRNLFVTLILIFTAKLSFACDASIEKFSRDCWMQDRVAKLRETYAAKGINLDEIGEYKVLRFIDRHSWEKAKTFKRAPHKIYDPAPATWKVWENGINTTFNDLPKKHALNTHINLDKNSFAKINEILLTDGTTSIKDKVTDSNKKPGEYRIQNDNAVGFCAEADKAQEFAESIQKSEESLARFQQRWESLVGLRFSDVVKNEGGPDFDNANFLSQMTVSETGCHRDRTVFIQYSPTIEVMNQIEWISIFIKTNLQSYVRGEAYLAPVEFAAFVQKWFVSVHPFADGNGRTSRAIQEMIMYNFGLPFVPAGDLQNDALDDLDNYVENTYKKLDSMLTELEMCVDKREKWRIPRACRTIEELNKTNNEYTPQTNLHGAG